MVSNIKIKIRSKKFFYIYAILIISLTIFISFEIIQSSNPRITFLEYKSHNREDSEKPLFMVYDNEKKIDYNLISNYEGNFSWVARIGNEIITLKPTNVKINSDGFRDCEFSINKSKNTFRIIALGDSFTFGWGIEINDTWPKQLEKKLNDPNLSYNFEVLNFGKGGANTKEEVELFKKYVSSIKPDMLILQYYYNDLEPTSTEINNRAREIFKKWESGEYKLPANMEEDIKKYNIDKDSVYMTILIGYLNKFYTSSDLENEWNKNVGPSLLELFSICKDRNIKIFVITWDFNQGPDIQREKIKIVLKENKINFYDFTSDIPFIPQPSIIRLPDGHLTPLGNEIVANKTVDIVLNFVK